MAFDLTPVSSFFSVDHRHPSPTFAAVQIQRAVCGQVLVEVQDMHHCYLNWISNAGIGVNAGNLLGEREKNENY